MGLAGTIATTIHGRYLVLPPAGQPASIPFFTVWKRDAPNQPWRYIAE